MYWLIPNVTASRKKISVAAKTSGFGAEKQDTQQVVREIGYIFLIFAGEKSTTGEKMGSRQYTTDDDYVRDIRAGGLVRELATEALYRKYRAETTSKVKAYLHFRSGIQDDAQDMAQDAFIVMVEKIAHGGYNEGSLLHFWIGITKGLLRNKLKRDAKTDLMDDHSQLDQIEAISADDLLISEENKQLLDQILGKLGERCRKVLLMWAGGYSMDEIADALQLSSEAMARKIKYKCKNQLMDMMDITELDL